MRTFIALSLNEKLYSELSELQAKLRGSDVDIKWIDPSSIHLTLKFLGEIDEKQLGSIRSCLTGALKDHKSFSVSLAGVGVFPKPSYPRVVWVGIDAGASECEGLNRDIENATAGVGFEKETRPFKAHLTLGRVRSSKNKQILIKAIEQEIGFASQGKAYVDKIILFKSTLTPKGALHTPLEEFPLL